MYACMPVCMCECLACNKANENVNLFHNNLNHIQTAKMNKKKFV